MNNVFESFQWKNWDEFFESKKQIETIKKSTPKKTREIIMKNSIPKSAMPISWSNGVYISSWKFITQDFNNFNYDNLQNTKDITFHIYDTKTGEEIKKLEIPFFLWEKLWEYLRNKKEIEENEKYRLPDWLKKYPVNCESFVYYIKWWFDKKPKLWLKYIKTQADEINVDVWDVLYIHTWDEVIWEYRHYMIYIWDGFCISKNWHAWLMVSRQILLWLYQVYEK